LRLLYIIYYYILFILNNYYILFFEIIHVWIYAWERKKKYWVSWESHWVTPGECVRETMSKRVSERIFDYKRMIFENIVWEVKDWFSDLRRK